MAAVNEKARENMTEEEVAAIVEKALDEESKGGTVSGGGRRGGRETGEAVMGHRLGVTHLGVRVWALGGLTRL